MVCQMKVVQIKDVRENPVSALRKVWRAMRCVYYADGLAYSLNSLRIYSFKEFSSDWVKTLEDRVRKLNGAGGEWHGIRDEIAGNFLSAFISYSGCFSAVNDMLSGGKEIPAEEIISMIQELRGKADEYVKTMYDANRKFSQWSQLIETHFSLLDESVQEGWEALDVDEATVSELVGKLTRLQDALVDAQDKILPEFADNEKDFIQSIGKIVYTALIAGESISYLSAGALFVSVGTTLYEALSKYMDVVKFSEEVGRCKMALSLGQQALAQTKSLLQFLHALQIRIKNLDNEFDEIIDIWKGEREYLETLLESYTRGADPKETALTVKAVMWKQLSQYAGRLMDGNMKESKFKINL